MEPIGNKIGQFFMLLDKEKKGKYTSYKCLCVPLNVSEGPTKIQLNNEENIWEQTINYEKIYFRCCHCQKHGHLIRNYSMNPPTLTKQSPQLHEINYYTKITNHHKTSKKINEGKSSSTYLGTNRYTFPQQITKEEQEGDENQSYTINESPTPKPT